MSKHAKYPPSASSRQTGCPASATLEQGLPSTSSSAALDGTAKHFLAETLLKANLNNSSTFAGMQISVMSNGDCHFGDKKQAAAIFKIDPDFMQAVDYGINYVRQIDGQKFAEVSLPIDHITGEKGAKGTADVVVIDGDCLTVVDYKFGRGRVSAYKNTQLMIYAMAALVHFKQISEHVTKVKLVIIQPAIDAIDVYTMPLDELRAFYREVVKKYAHIATLTPDNLQPSDFGLSDENCKFCKAKAICPAYTNFVMSAQPDTPPSDDKLADNYRMLPMIKSWCDAVEKLMFAKLERGDNVEGFELREGKLGNRKWSDESAVINLLKQRNQSIEMFTKESLISPTEVAKLAKKKIIDDDLQAALDNLVIRPAGKPTIFETQQSVIDEFDDLS